MQVSKISSFNFMGVNKKVITNAAKKETCVNPMKQFVEETPDLHEFYPPRNLIKENKNNVAVDFYSPREVIDFDNKSKSDKASIEEVNAWVAQKRAEIKK